MKMTTSAKESRQLRWSHRVENEHGRIVNPAAPESVHGTSYGYVGWGCRCERCADWSSKSGAAATKRRIHNQLILMGMQLRLRLGGTCNVGELAEKPGHGGEGGDTLHQGMTADDHAAMRHLQDQVIRFVPPDDESQEKVEKAFDRGVKRQTRRPVTEVHLTPDLPAAPPVITSVRERITSVAELEAISKAYFDPQWRAPATGHDTGEARERRAHGTMEIIVGENDGPVLWFSEREVGTGESEVLNPTIKGIKKAKGGRGGSTDPTTYKDLLDRLKAAGCTVSVTGSGHHKVEKDDRFVILPRSASDIRSIKNSVMEARNQGLL